jgi:hypothetical protein
MPASKELWRSVVKCVSSDSSIRLFRRRLPEVEAPAAQIAFRSVSGFSNAAAPRPATVRRG